jgi:hypothetical protein
VKLIDNNSVEYNESVRQKLLINEARKIEGKRLFITLDADEIFTPNVLTSAEWQTILTSKPGTILKFQWANFASDLSTMWLGYHFPWGYMDDGFEQSEQKAIHNGRIPIPSNHDVIEFHQIKVIHFQFTDWAKMQSKHRFYQCFETINYPERHAVDIFRQYHHMLAIPKDQIISIPTEWIEEYNRLEIDITSVYIETYNWFEEQVVGFIETYGAEMFKKLNIWDVDWVEMAKSYGKSDYEKYNDPRSKLDKYVQNWLITTQNKLHFRKYRRLQRILKIIYK